MLQHLYPAEPPLAHSDSTEPAQPMLSLEDSMVRPRPLRSWSAGDHSDIARLVSTALRDWSKAWGIGSEGGLRLEPVRCQSWFEAPAELPDPVDWSPLGSAATGLTWAAMARGSCRRPTRRGDPGTLRAVLADAMFGVGGWMGSALPAEPPADGGGVAGELVERAWDDLVARLGTALHASDCLEAVARPQSRESAGWSGAALVSIAWGERDLVLSVPGSCVARCLTAPKTARATRVSGGLTPIHRALAGQRLRMRVLLRPFELDLCTLASLRPGDVLCTTHPLAIPFDVRMEGEPEQAEGNPCAGFLGTVEGRRAIELTTRPRAADAER